MINPERETTIRDRVGMLDIEYWLPDPKRGATEDVFYINTKDKEMFDLFNKACQAIDKSKITLEGMKHPLNLFHQIGCGNEIGETGYECLAENIPLHSGLNNYVKALIREKMIEFAGDK